MKPAPIRVDDTTRLAQLNAPGILGTPDEHYFDCITATGARLFGVPICLISLVDAERQWFRLLHRVELSPARRTA